MSYTSSHGIGSIAIVHLHHSQQSSGCLVLCVWTADAICCDRHNGSTLSPPLKPFTDRHDPHANLAKDANTTGQTTEKLKSLQHLFSSSREGITGIARDRPRGSKRPAASNKTQTYSPLNRGKYCERRPPEHTRNPYV